MRFQCLFALLALLGTAVAQDDTASSDATSDEGDVGSDDLTLATETLAPTTTISMPPTIESGAWNITYFIAPTRNNYWVNDNVNTAAWQPLNVATNLILTNSNTSIMSQSIVLAQNLEPGQGNFAGPISNLVPGNNYILWLTVAGNPSQKLAQTQGFHIKANSTAAIQVIQSASAAAASITGGGGGSVGGAAATGAVSTGADGSTTPDGGSTSDPAYTPSTKSAATSVAGISASVVGLAGLALALAL